MPGPEREAHAVELRHDLADRLVAARAISSPAVEAAFRRVPRHLFTPGLGLDAAYANEVALIKRGPDGVPTSSVSAPDIQAIMLEQAALRPGQAVLEIGSGGYDAALIAELVGPAGRVVSVDIDPEVVARARDCLAAAGYTDVAVVLGDAEAGVADAAPFDRIIVTVESWDVPPAWFRQLRSDGRIVVPLRIRGLTRSLALDLVPGAPSGAVQDGHDAALAAGDIPQGPHLVSRSAEACGFVRMQGAGRHPEHQVLLAEEIELVFDEQPAPTEAEVAVWDAAVRGARAEAWSDVLAWRGEGWPSLPFWLATVYPGFCQIAVNPFRDTGRAAPANPWGCPAAVVDGHVVYLASRRVGEGVAELGAHAFGPSAAGVAEHFADQVRRWDLDHRDGPDPGPEFTVWPRPAPVLPADLVVEKTHTRIALRW